VLGTASSAAADQTVTYTQPILFAYKHANASSQHPLLHECEQFTSEQAPTLKDRWQSPPLEQPAPFAVLTQAVPLMQTRPLFESLQVEAFLQDALLTSGMIVVGS
jgi:hypothetical protein